MTSTLSSVLVLSLALAACGTGNISGGNGTPDASMADGGSDAGTFDGGHTQPDGAQADASEPLSNIDSLGPQAEGSYEHDVTNPHSAIDYFVDSESGDDSRAGTSVAQAWRTLAKASTAAFAPGDRLLLARGSRFREQLTWTRSGTSTAPIRIAAYGVGAAPIISGAEMVSGWTVHAGDVYRASVPSVTGVEDLYIEGARQTRARFPNADAAQPFLFKDVDATEHPEQANGVRYLRDAELPAAPGGVSYVGASIVTRVAAHAYLPASVSDEDLGNHLLSINFRAYNEYLNPSGEWPQFQWGYFFFDKLEFLDQAGEWHFDSATHTLYLWAPGSVDPSSLSVEVPVRDYGIFAVDQVHDVAIEGVQFEGARLGGIRIENRNERVAIEHNEIRNTMAGIMGWGDRNTNIAFNSLHDIWERAVDLRGSDGLTMSYNRAERIALVEGRAASEWTYVAVDLQRIDGGTLTMNVHHNEIVNTGYIGLILAGPGVAEYNLFDGPMQMLNDGGGFGPEHVAWNESVVYRYNILNNCVGNIASIAPDYHHYYPMCFGIYFGDHSPANALIEHNTVVNASGAGTLVDSSRIRDEHGDIVPVMGQVVRDNIFFGCKTGILLTDQSLYWSDYSLLGCDPRLNSPCFVPLIDKQVFGNTIYSTASDQIGMRMHYVYSDGAGHWVNFGSSNMNHIFQPFTPTNVVVRQFDSGLTPSFHGAASAWHTMTLEEWSTETGNDAMSVSQSSAPSLAPPETRGVLLCNPHFAARELSVASGTLESCLFDLDGNALGASITLDAMECLVAERGTACPGG